MQFKYNALDRIKAKIRRFWTEDNWRYLRIVYVSVVISYDVRRKY